MGFAAGRSVVRSYLNLADWKTAVSRYGFLSRYEFIRRQRKIVRRRTPTDASRRVVLRTMAGAEEPIEVALMRDRNAPKMRADADEHCHSSWPALTRFSSVSGSGSVANIHVAGVIDLLLGAVGDVDRLAAPEYFDGLAFCDRRQSTSIGAPAMVELRIHLRDQRHNRCSRANAATEPVAT